MSLIIVKAAYDEDAGVWFVESSDLAGLHVEAKTVEELKHQVMLAVEDLLELKFSGSAFDVPVEIIAHASTRARSHAHA